jgi:hypothetical protein
LNVANPAKVYLLNIPRGKRAGVRCGCNDVARWFANRIAAPYYLIIVPIVTPLIVPHRGAFFSPKPELLLSIPPF